MSIETFLTDWQKVQDGIQKLMLGHELTKLKPVILREYQRQLNHENLAATLAEMATGEGWLMLPDEIVRLPSQKACSSEQFPLEAEVRMGPQTWQLRHLHADQWLLKTIEIEECLASDATHLAQKIRHKASRKQEPDLLYEVLWELEEGLEPRRSSALFIGFEERQE